MRELRRKEKERRKIERTNRRALRLLEKNNTLAQQSSGVLLDHRKGSIVDPSVLKALREGEEQSETESPSANAGKEEEEEATVAAATMHILVPSEEDEDIVADEDEEEDEDEAEVEDDEEEEEEAEDEDEDDDDDDEKTSQIINQRTELDETVTTTSSDMNKNQAEVENKEWPELPPPPLKGILVASGFRFVIDLHILGKYAV